MSGLLLDLLNSFVLDLFARLRRAVCYCSRKRCYFRLADRLVEISKIIQAK